MKTIDVSKIWESLGTFWGQFPDKELFTKLWENYKNVIDKLYSKEIDIHLSKYMKYIPTILNKTDITYTPIFSGDNKNTITISGLEAIPIESYTFSIPTLSGIETGQLLIENEDYQIYDKNYIQFLTTPEFDSSNIGIENSVTLYADNVYQHNPILWDVHASGIGLSINSLDNEYYLPYIIITESGVQRTNDIAEHYRYLIWALEEIKRRPPTIQNLINGFGISRGLPFAYRAGLVTNIIDNTISVLVSGLTNTYDNYIIPSGYNITVNSGQNIESFYILMSGINYYDYVNDYERIMNLSRITDLNYTKEIIISYNHNLNNLNYNSTFHLNYIKSLIPKGLNLNIISE